MSDKELMLLSTLEDIRISIALILERFETIETSDDFFDDANGLEKLDSISMRLIVIGEGFKNIDKLTDSKLLNKYPYIDWNGVKGVRDVLSHHYFQIDAEIIFDICEHHLLELLDVVEKIILEVKI